MKLIADFHLHSKYSRAVSPKMDLENMDKWASIKGVDVLTTGDFTHPDWFKILKEKLEPSEQGLFRLKNSRFKTRFILTTEISNIYVKNGKTRKIHNVIGASSFKIAEKINNCLSSIGNLRADGRPILKLESKELLKIVLDVSEDYFFTPAHIWTPYFGLLGSKSGFDSIEECFEDYSKYIYSVETGLSSDPPMNRRLSELDRITLISNSDAHSLQKIGREANVFDTELSYSSILSAIKNKDPKKFLYTIEFYPQEGKYYYDGHRECEVSCSPAQTKKYNGVCPVCGKPLTVGVLNRVEQLADKPEELQSHNVIPYKSIVPLSAIIAETLGVGEGTKKVEKYYQALIEKFGSEFKCLLDVPESDLKLATLPEIVERILMARKGKLEVKPGYDGVFGRIKFFSHNKKRYPLKQSTLF
ncbi:MAG: endonuclease Q family protein [Patescibacteria group bacterium]|nr:endonuclease Q family protein [Patescibacteria group bacterium]